MLPVQTFNEIADATWGALLLAKGFVAVRPRLWVRSRLEFGRDVVELCAIKGASFTLRCGLSLNFVPHVQSGVLRWHRTPKSVVVDLNLPLPELQELQGANDAPYFARSRLPFTPSLLGSAKFNTELARSCSPFQTEAADAQLARVTTLAQVAQAFERTRPNPSTFSFVQHPIGFAFTLARLGRLAEARLELAKFSEMDVESMAKRLSAELEKAASVDSPAGALKQGKRRTKPL
jgi:hypothetical protein